jgi:hypothetical protein
MKAEIAGREQLGLDPPHCSDENRLEVRGSFGERRGDGKCRHEVAPSSPTGDQDGALPYLHRPHPSRET